MSSIIAKIKALRSLPGAHALSLRKPLLDFEVATMVLSALEYRENVGEITLFGDEAALDWASSTGINALYNRTVRLGYSSDSPVFWAMSKLEALWRMPNPCCILDIDAVLTRRPPLSLDVLALHSEPLHWQVYQRCPLRDLIHAKLGLAPDDSRVVPMNTAVLMIGSSELSREYTDLAFTISLMESCFPTITPEQSIVINGSPVAQMVLVEQYLLGALVLARGYRSGFLGDVTYDTISRDVHLFKNPDVMHLWNSKRFYANHGAARKVLLNTLMERIFKLMAGSRSHELVKIAHKCGLPCRRVVDANMGVVRWSGAGEWYGPGETVTHL